MSLDADITLLRSAFPLNALDSDALRLLAFAADTRMLREGDVLFRKGDRSDGAYVVRKGRIALDSSGDGVGAPFVVMPGSLIGRISLFAAIPRPATATSLELSSVIRLTPSLIRRVWDEFPHSLSRVQEALSEDLAELNNRLKKVHERLELGLPPG